jgi:hypothetical protein
MPHRIGLLNKHAQAIRTQLVVIELTHPLLDAAVVALLGTLVVIVEGGDESISLLHELGRVGQVDAQGMLAPALPLFLVGSPDGLTDHRGRETTNKAETILETVGGDLPERAILRRRSILELLDAVELPQDIVVLLLKGVVGVLESFGAISEHGRHGRNWSCVAPVFYTSHCICVY